MQSNKQPADETILLIARRVAVYWFRPSISQINAMLRSEAIDPSSLTAVEAAHIFPAQEPYWQRLRKSYYDVRNWPVFRSSGAEGKADKDSERFADKIRDTEASVKAKYEVVVEEANARAEETFRKNMALYRLLELKKWVKALEDAQRGAMDDVEAEMKAVMNGNGMG